MTREELRHWLARHIGEVRGVAAETIDPRERFTRLGLDSLLLTRIMADLSTLLGRPIAPTLAWEYPSIELLAAYLTEGETRSSPDATGMPARDRIGLDEPGIIKRGGYTGSHSGGGRSTGPRVATGGRPGR